MEHEETQAKKRRNDQESAQIKVPIPFQLPPLPYDATDHPWVTDKQSSIPDTFGLKYCPK